MKYIPLFALLLMSCLSCDSSKPQQSLTFRSMSLHSSVLGQEREILIFLPEKYDSTGLHRYSVMYVLDGGGEQDASMAEKCEALSVSDSIPQLIIVGIPNMSKENREKQLVPPFMKIDHEAEDSAPGEGDAFLEFMDKELFPFVESRFHVSDTRLFFGNSRGGLLVMYSLIYKPDLFKVRFCCSTPFWREENRMVHEVSNFLSKADTLNTSLYMRVGQEETENMRSGNEAMAAMLKDKAGSGFRWRFNYTPGANHQTNASTASHLDVKDWGIYVRNGSH